MATGVVRLTACTLVEVVRRTVGTPRELVRRVATVGSRSASTSANSLIFWKRSAGVFSSDWSTRSSSSSGTDCRTMRMLGTCSMACRARIARELGPSNGGCPASSSYRTQPRL
jgi:hypothetical protein